MGTIFNETAINYRDGNRLGSSQILPCPDPTNKNVGVANSNPAERERLLLLLFFFFSKERDYYKIYPFVYADFDVKRRDAPARQE